MEIIKHEYINEKGFGTYYMFSDGSGLARVYGFNDEKKYMVLDSLSINNDNRKKGLGTKLQKLREEYAKESGCEYTYLWVIKSSWMYEWYQRRGYVDCGVYDQEDGCVWMRKTL